MKNAHLEALTDTQKTIAIEAYETLRATGARASVAANVAIRYARRFPITVSVEV